VNSVHYDSFCDAACPSGLIEEDTMLDECLTENSMFQMPSSLRRLFTTILVLCDPKDVDGLWTKHFDTMAEDFKATIQTRVGWNKWFWLTLEHDAISG
jgi:hypothetical protein